LAMIFSTQIIIARDFQFGKRQRDMNPALNFNPKQ
jgi:hypothetical protein